MHVDTHYTYICAKRDQNPTAQKGMSDYWKKCPEEANNLFISGHEDANFSLEEANTRNFVELEGEEANIFVGGG